MTPFDWFRFSLRFGVGLVGLALGVVSPGTESSGTSGGDVGLGAWANAEPATSVPPATNRQSRELIAIMVPKLVDVRSVPCGRKEAVRSCQGKTTIGHFPPRLARSAVPFHEQKQ
jgi:hypothetical protein